MKTLIKLSIFLLTTVAFSQERLEKSIGKFEEIKVFDGISVTLVKSDANKIEISGEDVDKMSVINKNGRLKLRMKISRRFRGHKTFATVYYNGKLTVIDANENSFITSDDFIENVNLDVKAQEGGEIKVKTDVQRLFVKAVTGGKVEVTGDAVNQNISINTGGKYEGDTLKTEQTKVNVLAGGYAYVNASEYVSASVRTGGTVRIYGNPKVIDKKTFLGGRIIEQ